MDEIATAVRRFGEALKCRDRALVNDAARSLIELGAPLGSQWQSVAAALERNGEFGLAEAALGQLPDELKRRGPARLALANLLYARGRIDEALAELDRRISEAPAASVPEKLSEQNFRSSLLLLTGRREEARQALDRAIGLDPRSGQAWLTLAEIADFRGADAELVAELERAWAVGASLSSEQAKLAHAVGRMRHQLRDHAGAFEAFSSGARQFQRQARGAGDRAPRQSPSAGWTRELIERVSASITVPHGNVLFVSGLPRSGTTLVEQILASHPRIDAGEELGFFRLLAQEIGGIDADSFQAWLDRGGDPNRLVEIYLHLARERFGPGVRFVDKTIEAGNYMGLLLALFPTAPVFWLRRDPIDNGWSAFRTYFARGASWSWDLATIGRRLAEADEQAAHWSREAGDRITFIDYPDLVRDPKPNIRRIAEAAGLDAADSMFRPHETKRTVTSASVSQVRQPINIAGLGVAEPYRRWLGPMVDAYRQASRVTDRSD